MARAPLAMSKNTGYQLIHELITRLHAKLVKVIPTSPLPDPFVHFIGGQLQTPIMMDQRQILKVKQEQKIAALDLQIASSIVTNKEIIDISIGKGKGKPSSKQLSSSKKGGKGKGGKPKGKGKGRGGYGSRSEDQGSPRIR